MSQEARDRDGLASVSIQSSVEMHGPVRWENLNIANPSELAGNPARIGSELPTELSRGSQNPIGSEHLTSPIVARLHAFTKMANLTRYRV